MKKYTAKDLKKQLKKRIKQYLTTDFIAVHKSTARRIIKVLDKKER